MKITLRNLREEEISSDAVVLPFCEGPFPDLYSDLDALVGGLIKRVMVSGEFSGKEEETTLLHVKQINTPLLLLVGLGKESEITTERLRKAGGISLSRLKKSKNVALSTSLFDRIAAPLSRKAIFSFLEGCLLGQYRFEKYKKPENGRALKEITVLSPDTNIPLKRIESLVSAVSLARDMVNTPSNDMTPSVMATVAEELSGKRLKVKVLSRKDAEKEAMGAYLAVAKGSEEPPCFIVMEYSGGKGAPWALVGKAITFDSGGISLKPAEGMEKMKYDMAGGAAVLGVMKAVSELEMPLNIVAILPATENMPGGHASRPGDIVKTLTGKTVEIVNTDAEGRLILADAIGYAIKHYKPRAVIDIATLTGSCSLALGSEAMAMMGTEQGLMEMIGKAGEETRERAWQMPLYDEYKEYIKSDAADIKNSGGRNGSLVTAAYFLREFTGETPWVHLDIAGTAWNDKDRPYSPKGASGIGVRLLLEFFAQQTEQ
ncbi:MAG: leucyl aminopeptidase [Nitrospirales bacterium]|nr:leucyl aminopeptidase [Nitrospirales bacterium]